MDELIECRLLRDRRDADGLRRADLDVGPGGPAEDRDGARRIVGLEHVARLEDPALRQQRPQDDGPSPSAAPAG